MSYFIGIIHIVKSSWDKAESVYLDNKSINFKLAFHP